MKKNHSHQASKRQRKVKSQRKKWTNAERFNNTQVNRRRVALTNNKTPPVVRVKSKLNPTQQFEQRQHQLKRTSAITEFEGTKTTVEAATTEPDTQ